MKNKDYLTVRQEELMNFLWKVNEPLTANEMAERLAEDGWNNVTLFKTVQSLTTDGYLEVVGLVIVLVVVHKVAAEALVADTPLDRLGLHLGERRHRGQQQSEGEQRTAHGELLRWGCSYATDAGFSACESRDGSDDAHAGDAGNRLRIEAG